MKHVGSRACNNAARNPDNAAVLFQRLMGTSTPVKLPAVNLTMTPDMTPEECSAEVKPPLTRPAAAPPAPGRLEARIAWQKKS